MKIIHTSDLHLDSPLTARLPADKLRERKRELLRGFCDLVTEAGRIGATAVIIAGDLFDSERVTARTRDTVLDAIAAAANISFFYLRGNHDGSFDTSTRAIPKNLYSFEGDGWVGYDLCAGVRIVGHNAPLDSDFSALNSLLREEDVNICVLHGELRDRGNGGESFGKGATTGHGIDYLAMGHYHSYSEEQLDERTVAVYCGTPEGRGFDETGEKGYSLIEISSGKLTHRFVPFAKRRIREVEVNASGATSHRDISERAAFALRSVPVTDIVRLKLVGGIQPGVWKDTEALAEEFGSRFYYFEVKDATRLEIRPEDFIGDRSLKGEFIRTVSAASDLDEETKMRIINCGLHALMGEELPI